MSGGKKGTKDHADAGYTEARLWVPSLMAGLLTKVPSASYMAQVMREDPTTTFVLHAMEVGPLSRFVIGYFQGRRGAAVSWCVFEEPVDSLRRTAVKIVSHGVIPRGTAGRPAKAVAMIRLRAEHDQKKRPEDTNTSTTSNNTKETTS